MSCFEPGIHNTLALYWAITLWQEALLVGPPGEHSLNRIWLPVDLKNVGAPERATPVFP